jgi:hypothetical protein
MQGQNDNVTLLVMPTDFPDERESAQDAIDECRESIHPLAIVLGDALEQAVGGKGEERHGGGLDYLDQPWVRLARDHGGGFLTGQASKKIEEAVSNHANWTAEQFRNELLGAINYLGMAVVFNDLREALRSGEISDPALAVKLGVPVEVAERFALAVEGFNLFGRGDHGPGHGLTCAEDCPGENICHSMGKCIDFGRR